MEEQKNERIQYTEKHLGEHLAESGATSYERGKARGRLSRPGLIMRRAKQKERASVHASRDRISFTEREEYIRGWLDGYAEEE